jgi:hypothetical protein
MSALNRRKIGRNQCAMRVRPGATREKHRPAMVRMDNRLQATN